MRDKERAIFIGRFQPFHKGHIAVIEKMDQADGFEEIIIGIGSSQYDHFPKNPFTTREREEMIRKSIEEIKKPVIIRDIPDINADSLWVSHVERLTPRFKIAYTGNPWVEKLFRGKGYEVRDTHPTYEISATDIREKMIRGENWQEDLPEGSLEVLKEIRGSERVRDMYCQHINPAVTADLIIPRPKGLVLTQRRNGPGSVYGGMWALPGGFVNAGRETTAEAAIRECFEETSLRVLDLELVDVVSHPDRDPRQPTVSVVYLVKRTEGELKAGDDAVGIGEFPFMNLPRPLAFDHDTIVSNCLSSRKLL